MKIKDLQKKYESTCNEYLSKFCEKQEMTNEGWVGDNTGQIALCSDYCFNLHDIVHDINTDQPKGLIVDWYDDNLENPDKAINYYSYTQGLRIEDVKKCK